MSSHRFKRVTLGEEVEEVQEGVLTNRGAGRSHHGQARSQGMGTAAGLGLLQQHKGSKTAHSHLGPFPAIPCWEVTFVLWAFIFSSIKWVQSVTTVQKLASTPGVMGQTQAQSHED